MNREELAWAAGFFDGEGYIGLAHQHWKKKCRYQLHAHISQVDTRVLERFKAVVGFGGITSRSNEGLRKKHPEWKPQWRWDVSSFEYVQALGAMLWYFLSPIKREQFKQAMLAAKEWRENRETVRNRCNKKF